MESRVADCGALHPFADLFFSLVRNVRNSPEKTLRRTGVELRHLISGYVRARNAWAVKTGNNGNRNHDGSPKPDVNKFQA